MFRRGKEVVMSLFTLAELEDAARFVHARMPPTPQYAWPLLAKRLGADVWVKHENHTPTGAFKVRGGIMYIDWLKRTRPEVAGVISATRGNHGQSIARAARAAGLRAVIYVPHGNSVEKNRAMEAFGAELVVHGRDFDEAKEECARAAEREGLHFVPSFHRLLVLGVATYAHELFSAVERLDAVYVPIGMGSGICGLIETRDVMGLSTEIIGVVAEGAPTVALSFEAGRPIATNSAVTFADGMACGEPNVEALDIVRRGASRVVRVSDEEIAEAIRALYVDTHNIAEGAGAAALAAAMRDRRQIAGRRVAVILCGGNIDTPVFATVLGGGTPRAG